VISSFLDELTVIALYGSLFVTVVEPALLIVASSVL
jgi:hypothetical protein